MSIPDTIERTVEIPLPIERVWAAITTPEEVARWFSDHATFTLEVGSRMDLKWDDYGEGSCTIETIDAPSHFAFRWRAQGVSEDEPMTINNSTLVSFLLTTTDAGTQVKVVESGLTNLPVDMATATQKDNTGGWEHEMGDLVAYLEGQVT